MKYCTLFLLFFLGPLFALAQYPTWEVEVSLGYSNDFNTQSPQITQWVSSGFNQNLNYSNVREYHGYSNGPKATIGVGISLSKGLGIDGQFSYSYGTSSSIERYDAQFRLEKLTTGGQLISFSPMLRLYKEFKYWENAQIYARVGPVFGTAYTFLETDIDTGFTELKLETDWTFDIGFQGSVGLVIPVSNNLSLITEIQYFYLNSRPSSAEYTKVDFNGEDQLPYLTDRQKEIRYVEELEFAQNDPDKPQDVLQITSPFSHFAINLGLRLTL